MKSCPRHCDFERLTNYLGFMKIVKTVYLSVGFIWQGSSMNKSTLFKGLHVRWTKTIADVLHSKKMLRGGGFEVDSHTCWNCCMKHQRSLKTQRGAIKIKEKRERFFQRSLLKSSKRRIQTLLPNLPKAKTLSDVIQPVKVTVYQTDSPNNQTNGTNVGEEVAGRLDKDKLQQLLQGVSANPEIRELLQEELELDESMLRNVVESFSQYCQKSPSLPVSLHVQLYDLLNGAGAEADLAPYMIEHGRRVYPHCTVMDDLERLCISNMTNPFDWFPEAREMKRKIIYHSGPTNSGKTFAALESFLKAKTGVYLAPLRLLAIECCTSTNSKDVPCDLLTGERRYFINGKDNPADHRSSTIELLDLEANYDVAVIDEIQMIADISRGGHWTAALLGVKAKEVHVCGDGSVINLVKSLTKQCGDSFQLLEYSRKSPLNIQDEPLGSLENVKPGDCIVCFQVKHVFEIAEQLKKIGHKCALIYGALPPGIKIHQTEIFNKQDNSCNILVATDAVGMGLNLAIQRIIFHGIEKQALQENGSELIQKFTMKKTQITSSQAKQIAGRAGRYGGLYNAGGEVTAFHEKDLKALKNILNQEIPDIKRAGLTIRDDIVETIAYHLPGVPLSSILMIFVAICKTDSQFFLCNAGAVIQNAMLLDHIEMPVKEKLLFCQAPLRHTTSSKSIALFMKMASLVSKGQTLNLDWFLAVSEFFISDLEELKSFDHALEVFHMTDIYLWLRFEQFQDVERMRSFRIELDKALREYIEKTYCDIDPEEAIRKAPSPDIKKTIDDKLELVGEKRLQIKKSQIEKESDQLVLNQSNHIPTVPETVTKKEVKPFSMEDSNNILAEIWYESINYEPGEIKKKGRSDTSKLATAQGKQSKKIDDKVKRPEVPPKALPKKEVKKKPKEKSSEDLSSKSVGQPFVGQKLKGFLSFLQENKLNIKDGAVKWQGMTDQEQEQYIKEAP